ncbi:Protein hgh1 [Malassezia sp. CBS 17886]|nr:Protein hgh1 [Malassezia sp. CBS 17886]
MSVPASQEVLVFLADPNPQVRQMAMAAAAAFSAKGHPDRTLLVDKLKGPDGAPLTIWDGSPLDVLEQIKKLCRDQPLTVHDALSALINLSDSPSVALRIADAGFLAFLVSYIGDSVSLLADLACMLLSNLTKFDAAGARLLDLTVEDRPFYSFLSPQDLQLSLGGMDADPTEPDYEEKKRASQAAAERLASSMRDAPPAKLPALVKLLRAFEEGATVESSTASGADMRARVAESKQAAADADSDPVAMGADGRPSVNRKSNCNFLASVFANVSVIPRGREFLVTPMQQGRKDSADAYPVARLMVYTEHANLIRRGGVVSALKNILFIKRAHELLLAPPESDTNARRPPVDIFPYLLMPLIDGSELSKVDIEDQEALPPVCQLVDENKPREKDGALRLMLVESLLLLCTSLYGRECLRRRGAYIVVREAHLAEDKEEITEAILRLVNLLKRDESESTLKEADVAAEVGDETAGAPDGHEYEEDTVVEEL